MREKIELVWKYMCEHKYKVAIVIFLLIIGVFDENSWIKRWQNNMEIRRLEAEIQYYRKQFEHDSELLKEISTNPEALEKVAREKYKMKKENEDIYIFEEDLDK